MHSLFSVLSSFCMAHFRYDNLLNWDISLLSDPNVNILWIENADAKIRALRDIEAGLFWSILIHCSLDIYLVSPSILLACDIIVNGNCLFILFILFILFCIGEELCICYIDASMDCKARQVLLADGFGFQCHCLRCKSGD